MLKCATARRLRKWRDHSTRSSCRRHVSVWSIQQPNNGRWQVCLMPFAESMHDSTSRGIWQQLLVQPAPLGMLRRLCLIRSIIDSYTLMILTF